MTLWSTRDKRLTDQCSSASARCLSSVGCSRRTPSVNWTANLRALSSAGKLSNRAVRSSLLAPPQISIRYSALSANSRPLCLGPMAIQQSQAAQRASPQRLALSSDQFQLREQMAEFFFFGFQVPDVSRMRRDLDRHARNVHTVTAQAFYLVRIVGQQLHLANAEIAQNLRADSIVAEVLVEAEVQVRFDGVHPLVLQRVGANLVAEPDSAALLVEINHHAAVRRHDSLHRLLQLLTAVASRRRKHVAREALRMEPHQRRASAADLALDQRQMLAAIDDVAEDDSLQHAAIDGKRLLGNALDQNFIRQAI